LNLPREQILPQKISYQTAFNSLISSPKNFFLGSGPGTFYFQFLKIKPDSIFRTNLWQIRFDRPSNNISEILIDFGILGFLSFLSIFFIYFLISAFVFKKENSIFFLPILTLFFCQFFYYQNAILAFLLFFLLPLSLLNFKRGLSEFEYSLKEFPELNLVFSSIFLVFLIFFFFSGYLGFKIYLADFNFVKGIFGSGKERIERMEKGVSLNKNFSYYKIILAREYLTQVLQEAQKAPDVVDSQKITDFSVKAINTAREATKVSKENVFAWETLAIIYRELQPFAQGATDWTIDSFEMASSLDPKNPDLYLEIFKLDLVKNDLKKAREYLEKAKKLNENYIETRIQEAILLEREGNGEEAKNKLEKILEDFPFHVEANFNLGRIYFGEGEVDKAIPYFERAILVFPNHSNSLYSLGLCYEKKGDKEKALEYFNKVLELNPNNPVILQKIEELKK
jgi:tetratricopeptide (TPR) repeat protein